MGEKDIAEKRLEEYDDVFADIVNGLLFAGERVVSEEALEDAAGLSAYKADGRLREQERDVAKYWRADDGRRVGVRVALLGIENQTAYDRYMPLRVIGYDGAAYRAQLARSPREAPYPVVTLVLHFGDARWGRARSIHDAVDVPDRLRPYVSDYRINVFDVPYLSREEVARFAGDFGIVADYFSRRREDPDYRPSDPRAFRHADELLKLMSVMTRDPRFAETMEGGREEPRNMCEVLDRVEARGEARGRALGRESALVESVRNLMASTRWPAQRAMDALGVPAEERGRLMALL